MPAPGPITKLQRSFGYRVSKWFPSEFLRWIDVVSGVTDGASIFPFAVPLAGQVPTSTGTAWQTIGLSQGANLPTTVANLSITDGNVRFIRAATLTGNSTYTLLSAGAVLNDVIGVVREDTTAFTAAIVNGGPAAGTMFTFAADSVKRIAWFQFDGVDWFELSHAVITSSL